MSIARRLHRAVKRVSLARFESVEPRRLLASINGSYFYDANLNGTREPNEPATAGGRAFLDANDNGVFDGSISTPVSTDVPKAISDNTTITSLLNATGLGASLSDVNVTLSLTHTYVGDLNAYLISPSGTRVELFTSVGGSGDNIENLTLDDQAAAGIASATPPYTNLTLRPEGSLAAFNGLNGNGLWTLEIRDGAAGDTGTLTAWSLALTTGEQAAVSDANGAFSFVNLAAGTYTVRPTLAAGFESVSVAQTVTLATDTSTASVVFGHRQPPATASGTVFADYDRDGVRDSDEPGISGLTIYSDADNDFTLDAGEVTAPTSANGAYTFSNLIPGTYRFRVNLPAGYAQTSPTPQIEGNRGETIVGSPIVTTTTDGPPAARSFVKDEIVVATTRGRNIIGDLAASYGASIDLAQSAVLLPGHDQQLVTIKLKPGIDAEKLAKKFERRANVAWASFNYIYDDINPLEVIPNDPQITSQYFHTTMRNYEAWNITRGAGVKVGVTDNGFGLAHPDLIDNIYVNPGEVAGDGIDNDNNGYIDDVRGWDFTNSTATFKGDNDATPVLASDDHGTHVAGIVAARYDNATGVSGTAGEATIVPLRFYGTGNWTSTVISNTYRYAADNAIKIVTTSYNVDGFVNDPVFLAAVEYMYDNGVLHFNSAGNNSALNPARQAIDGSLYVASTEANDTRSSFSNYGTGIDISAPGGGILSTSLGATTTTYNYENMSGTSMATPNAAAAAALIWSAHPSWTRDQVAAQLIGTADNIDAVNSAYAGLLGSGRVDSYRGVTEALAAPRFDSVTGLPSEGSSTAASPTSFTLDLFSVLDPASANNLSNYRLLGAGIDNTFGTGDDTSIALTRDVAEYKLGTNRMTFSIGSTLPAGNYRVVIKAGGIVDPFGHPLDGNGDGVGNDDFVRNFTVSATSTAIVQTLAANQNAAGLNFGLRETLSPTVLGSLFDFQESQNLQVRFSEAMTPPTAAQLVLTNTNTGAVITTTPSVAYNMATNTATFTLSTPLRDGNYTAAITGTDRFGNALDGNGNGVGGDAATFNFFALAGDANHDRTVNFNDLVPLASNYNQTSRSFSQGDFNYSANGVVDFNDLVILAARYNQRLNEDGTFTTTAGRSFVSDLDAAQRRAGVRLAAAPATPRLAATPASGGRRVAEAVFSSQPIGVVGSDEAISTLLR